MSPRLATVVVGAGPGGLLFALMSRIFLSQRNGAASSWPILIIDKREGYSRTHQLALDPNVYRGVQQAIADPSFDEFLAFLESWKFKVPVNKLEQALLDLLMSREVVFKSLELERGNLDAIISQVPEINVHAESPWLSIVGADSVRSTVRETFMQPCHVKKGAHHFLARLRIEAQNLPEHLTFVDNIRLSKFISSLISYRLNPNGFAEMDLFLNEREFNEVLKLGATPKERYLFKADRMPRIRAPLFNKFISLALDYTKNDPSASISLQSTFKLEHSISERRFYVQRPKRRAFFLVGDAAIALPFQRGMSALVQSAYELALVHQELYRAVHEEQDDEVDTIGESYQAKTAEIVKKELAIVRGRARLVRALSYFSRISAMVPFPMQAMLSIDAHPQGTKKRLTATDAVNFLLALSSSVALSIPIAIVPAVGKNIFASVFVIAAFLIQFCGGMFYRFALAIDGTRYWSKVFWRTQVIIWLVLGIGGSLRETITLGHLHGWSYATLWWVGGVIFAIGLMGCDWIIKVATKDGEGE